MANCKSCGAPIEWARTETGANIPLDMGTVDGGNIEVDRRAGRPVARVVTAAPEVKRRVSHFATCPNASSHRTR